MRGKKTFKKVLKIITTPMVKTAQVLELADMLLFTRRDGINPPVSAYGTE